MGNLENNLDLSLAYCEAEGLGKCFSAYAKNCSGEDVMMVGFNPNSGYTYITLENGISICSMLANDVEYQVTNFDDGGETFFDNYDEAVAQNKIFK